MEDKYGRKIDYLRISVTDRCNLRCTYCMPPDGVHFKDHNEILRFEEIIRIVKLSTRLGIKKIRVTGGEPLVRKGIEGFIEELAAIKEIEDISMTTNGVLLKEKVPDLKAAGLKRVNISLDTLKPERFTSLTGLPLIDDVKSGIGAALEYGLTPIKINCVIVRGFNDDEISDFIELTKENPINIRFIEFMPLGNNSLWSKDKIIPSSEIIERYSSILKPTDILGGGPAKNFRLSGYIGTVGFISPISDHFCSKCNRIRLTADGKIKSCLESNDELDIKSIMRNGAKDDEVLACIAAGILSKPQEHSMDKTPHKQRERYMTQIGG